MASTSNRGWRRPSGALALAATVVLCAAAALGALPASAASTVSVPATADAYVGAGTPSTNFGTSVQLRIDGSPVSRTYLRFDLRSISGSVTNANLQLYANSASGMGYQVSNTGATWTETGLTYSNSPAVGTLVGSVGALSMAV
jgi:acid phosphatase type 7